MLTMTAEIALRELDHRTDDGIDVTLFWKPLANQVFIEVADRRSGEWCELEVEARDALGAFHQPFAYTGNHCDARSTSLEHLPTSCPCPAWRIRGGVARFGAAGLPLPSAEK